MRKTSHIVVLAAFALATPASAHAQDKQAETPVAEPEVSSRYELRKSDEGYLRLDRQTGAVSLCKVENAGLVCRLGAREREAYVEALDTMQQQLDDLRDRVDILETHLALSEDSGEPQADAETSQEEDGSAGDEIVPGSELAEREIDRAIEFTQRAMRRLFEAVQDMKRDMEKEEPAQ